MAAVNQGMLRVGVLLSALWMVAVGAFAVIEGQHRNDACAITPKLGACRFYFWAWETPVAATKPVQPREGEQPEEKFKRAIVKALVDVVEETKAREFRLQPQRLLAVMFGPLLFFWGVGFGVAWCIKGFQQPPKK